MIGLSIRETVHVFLECVNRCLNTFCPNQSFCRDKLQPRDEKQNHSWKPSFLFPLPAFCFRVCCVF